MTGLGFRALCSVVALAFAPLAFSQATPNIQLEVDASEAPRKLLHAKITFELTGGDLTLFYPKWIPGEHGPTGPIEFLAGITFEADGTPLSWKRDRANMFAFHLSPPRGARKLIAHLDFIASAGAGPFISGASTGRSFATINWNELILYPKGYDIKQIKVSPQLHLPQGWHQATALKVESFDQTTALFETVSLAHLIDSPVLAGATFREVPLGSVDGVDHFLDLAADTASALEITGSQIAGLRLMIKEAHAMLGNAHYNSYHFLVSLGDQLGSTGLEHHESSDDRIPESTFRDPAQAKLVAWLLPHEFTHSWNGKYRRPIGLINPDLQQPVDSESLWVYEGLTTYIGELLAVRSGLWTTSEFSDELALKVALAENHPGRQWRSLRDTAVSAQILANGSGGFDSWRCALDYYPEGEILWLEIDSRLRVLTGGKKTLDDFCRAFFGVGGDGSPRVLSYQEAEVIKALNDIAPDDWAGLIQQRLDGTGGKRLEFLSLAGFKLVYDEKPNEMAVLREKLQHIRDARFSLGISIKEDGVIQEVIFGSICAHAGILPGDKIIAINDQPFSFEVFSDSMSKSRREQKSVQVLVESQARFQVVSLPWIQGELFPKFQHASARTDLFQEVTAPCTSRDH